MGIPKYQDIVELLKTGQMMEAREKILELREAALALEEENLTLKTQLKQLQTDAELCGRMHFEKGAYWLNPSGGDGADLMGPYCQVCHDRDKRPVRLHRVTGPGGGWYCAVCRNQF